MPPGRTSDRQLTRKCEWISSLWRKSELANVIFFKAWIVGHNYWFIAIKKRGGDIFNLNNLAILRPPPGRFWADPFLADKYLFFEDSDYRKGTIGVGELDGVTLKDVHPVLDEPEHLSFPSVLHDRGYWYMTPERRNAGVLRVYQATEFPNRWEPLVDVAYGRYDDPLLRKGDQGFEVWTTREEGPRGRRTDVLHVFAAESIEGPWRLVRTDAAPFQRAAGNFIGDLRPTQDCATIYGRAIKFLRGNEVVRTIEPTWYPSLTGTHTFNVSDTHVVIDGRIRLPESRPAGRKRRPQLPRWLTGLWNR
jgi:hypothetical protein